MQRLNFGAEDLDVGLLVFLDQAVGGGAGRDALAVRADATEGLGIGGGGNGSERGEGDRQGEELGTHGELLDVAMGAVTVQAPIAPRHLGKAMDRQRENDGTERPAKGLLHGLVLFVGRRNGVAQDS